MNSAEREFASLSTTQRSANFVGSMTRSFASIKDLRAPDVCDMDSNVQFAEDPMPLQDTVPVRSDFDANAAWRFASTVEAEALRRGERELGTDLAWLRVEPDVAPNRSLTGDSTQRVDTRVLQVLYSFDPKLLHAYVGRQVDVFIEAPSILARPTTSATTH